MPYFAKRSLENLSTCEWNLQRVAQEAIKDIDFTVICGHRGEEDQQKAFVGGTSKLEYPKSKHNKYPSQAFDFIFCPFTNWNDTEKFIMVVNVIKVVATRLGIPIICGADWRMRDMGHIELSKTEE